MQDGFAIPKADLNVSLFEMLGVLSAVQDMVNPALNSHQQRVCLISSRIGRQLGLSGEEYSDLFCASLIHDIGAIPLQDRLSLLEFEQNAPHLHAKLGALLIRRFAPFAHLAPVILYHHVPWKNGRGACFFGNEVPLSSSIIFLADRIEVLVQKSQNILADVAEFRRIAQASRGSMFNPDCVDALIEISKSDSFWLDLKSAHLSEMITAIAPRKSVELDIEALVDLARFFAIVIDCRSRFTATHSAGVAACAQYLALSMGMSKDDAKRVLVAGYLHDIGKLAVSPAILEKNGNLDAQEFAQMRAHSYLSLEALSNVAGLAEIANWGGSHHERLDGSGYPNRATADNLPLPARIMAISDIFTALREARPYRDSLSISQTLAIIQKDVDAKKLDPDVFAKLLEVQDEIDLVRKKAQAQEAEDLKDFWVTAERKQKS